MVQPLHKNFVAQLKPHQLQINFGEIIWIGGSSKLVGGHLKPKPSGWLMKPSGWLMKPSCWLMKPSGWLMKETVSDLTITNPVVGSLAG